MYRHCILDCMSAEQLALCGKESPPALGRMWCFVSIQHWYMHNPKTNKILGCLDCLAVLEKKIVSQKQKLGAE